MLRDIKKELHHVTYKPLHEMFVFITAESERKKKNRTSQVFNVGAARKNFPLFKKNTEQD